MLFGAIRNQRVEPYSLTRESVEWENNAVPIFALGSSLAIVAALVSILGVPGPVGASEPSGCDLPRATIFRAAADRYRAHGQFADSAQWFLAATRATRDCSAPSDLMVGARSLLQAGAAFAMSGDYLRALSLLHVAQSHLTAIGGSDRETATAARSCLETIEDLIASINTIAQASM